MVGYYVKLRYDKLWYVTLCYVGAGVLGTQTCAASPLQTEPIPQPTAEVF